MKTVDGKVVCEPKQNIFRINDKVTNIISDKKHLEIVKMARTVFRPVSNYGVENWAMK